ncbi:MAG: hypothetical protein ACRDV3_11235 [Acidothermaceae bacterium]
MEITDDYMRSTMQKALPYTAVILHRTAAYGGDGTPAIIWEHGRRNMKLRAEGELVVVCPIKDATDVAGFGLFKGSVEQVEAILADDPAIQAGVLRYEIHPTRSLIGASDI